MEDNRCMFFDRACIGQSTTTANWPCPDCARTHPEALRQKFSENELKRKRQFDSYLEDVIEYQTPTSGYPCVARMHHRFYEVHPWVGVLLEILLKEGREPDKDWPGINPDMITCYNVAETIMLCSRCCSFLKTYAPEVFEKYFHGYGKLREGVPREVQEGEEDPVVKWKEVRKDTARIGS
ncbi:Nn.00g096390.m01.CDS01 [Neocucurbitaria sp. VM-36]